MLLLVKNENHKVELLMNCTERGGLPCGGELE